MAVDPRIRAVWDTYVAALNASDFDKPDVGDAWMSNECVEAIDQRLQQFTELELERAICVLWSDACPELLATRCPQDIFWKDVQVRTLLDIAEAHNG
jgi:hypothetical protein